MSFWYQPSVGREVTDISQHIGRVSIDISVECRPTCRPIYNLDLTKYQETGEIGSLCRGSFPYTVIHYTITGLKNIVRYTENFVT